MVRGNAGLSHFEKREIEEFLSFTKGSGRFGVESVIDYLKNRRGLKRRIPTTRQIQYYLSRRPGIRHAGRDYAWRSHRLYVLDSEEDG